MDILFNPVSGTIPAYQPPAVKLPSGSPLSGTTQVQEAVEPASTPAATSAASVNPGEQYLAAARQAALSFKDVYALGDQQFSIFKDVTGKYITRYVSLRDGKVTYLPEPTLVRQVQFAAANSTGRVAISA